MKFLKFVSIACLITVIITICSCGAHADMKKIEKQLDKLQEENYNIYVEEGSEKDIFQLSAILKDKFVIENNLISAYLILKKEGNDMDPSCWIMEFKTQEDAKNAVRFFGDMYNDDEFTRDFESIEELDSFGISREGKVIVFGEPSLQQKIH